MSELEDALGELRELERKLAFSENELKNENARRDRREDYFTKAVKRNDQGRAKKHEMSLRKREKNLRTYNEEASRLRQEVQRAKANISSLRIDYHVALLLELPLNDRKAVLDKWLKELEPDERLQWLAPWMQEPNTDHSN